MFKKLTSILFFPPLLAFGQNLGLGDFHQGGFVFYIDSLGKGLLLDVDYLEATYPWDTQNNTVSDWGPNLHYCEGTEYEAIGAGKHNTYVFSNHHPEGHYAANLCSNSTSGGFEDWFLPSKMELWQLMVNLDAVDAAISAYGGVTITDAGFQWSSTQLPASSDIRSALGVSPFNFLLNGDSYGPIEKVMSKNTAHKVRAVRCIDNDCSFTGASMFGCTDDLACNYNELATQNDGSCFVEELYYDCLGNCINDADMDQVCDEFDYDDGLSTIEIEESSGSLLKMIDILGRVHTTHKKGMLLFYIYKNGKVQKRMQY